MTDLSSKTALIIDQGLFLPLAIRLARDFGQVYYHCPDWSLFPTPNIECIGQGFENILSIDHAAPMADVTIFPDVGHWDMSSLIQSDSGQPVWGTRELQWMELDRINFRREQRRLGLPTPKYEVVKGLPDLRATLEGQIDCYVKISKFRGLSETHHWVGIDVDAPWLDMLAYKLGPLGEDFPFLVEQPVDAVAEEGFDGWCIDGQFPKTCVHGIEGKDKCYLGAVTSYDDLAPQLRETNAALAPLFKQYGYRNFWASEVRITEDGTGYLIDPCCRHSSPAGECLHELVANLSEIIWSGAHGEVVEPEFTAKFAAQAIIDHPGKPEGWRNLHVPEKARQWVKIYACCQRGEVLCVPPQPWSEKAIGSVVGIGDTIKEAIDHLHATAKLLDGQGLVIHSEALVDVLKSAKEETEAGVQFTDQPVPKPEEALP